MSIPCDGGMYGFPNATVCSKLNAQSNHGTDVMQVIEIGDNQDIEICDRRKNRDALELLRKCEQRKEVQREDVQR